MITRKAYVVLLFVSAAAVFFTIFIFSSFATTYPVTARTMESTTVFYDGALGGTPDQQDMEYKTFGIPFSQVVQTFAGGATTLDSTANSLDYAGYGITSTLVPTLDRAAGFRLNFTVQVESETHNDTNRAGFSVILLAQDLQGIELDFWEDTISAQEGGTADLFTFAEGVSYDTTSGLIDYTLEIVDDTYTLSVANTAILSGTVRDYTAWTPPLPGLPDPYEQPNLVYLGDNSSDGQARIRLAYVAVGVETAVSTPPTSTPTPEYKNMLPMITNE